MGSLRQSKPGCDGLNSGAAGLNLTTSTVSSFRSPRAAGSQVSTQTVARAQSLVSQPPFGTIQQVHLQQRMPPSCGQKAQFCGLRSWQRVCARGFCEAVGKLESDVESRETQNWLRYNGHRSNARLQPCTSFWTRRCVNYTEQPSNCVTNLK